MLHKPRKNGRMEIIKIKEMKGSGRGKGEVQPNKDYSTMDSPVPQAPPVHQTR